MTWPPRHFDEGKMQPHGLEVESRVRMEERWRAS